MEYKKLSEDELLALYKLLSNTFGENKKYNKIVALVTKYFTKPHSVLIKIESEYNDSTYDNQLGAVFVYDKDKDEIEWGLSRVDREKFTTELGHISIPHETNEPLEDVVLYVSTGFPEIYKKVK